MKKILMMALAAISMTVMQASAAQIIGTFNVNTGSVLTIPAVTTTSLSLLSNPIFLIQGEPTGVFGTELNNGDTITTSSLNLTSALGFTFSFFSGASQKFTFTPTSFQGANFINITNTGTVTSYDIFLIGDYSGPGYTGNSGEFNINFRTPSSGNPAVFAASGSGSAIPEPSTYAMLGGALVSLGLLRRRKA